MLVRCDRHPDFRKGSRVTSLVYHPPEVKPGDKGVIVSPRVGRIYAVKLPSGKLHEWLARFELKPLKNSPLQPGDKARILTDKGHPPMIKRGQVVTIVRVVYTSYYDLFIHKKYHRWLAEFELAKGKY